MRITDLTSRSEFFDDAMALLQTAGLDISDIGQTSVKLWVGYNTDSLIGVIGLEQSGEIGLLRSLAVKSEFQGHGYARTLCDLVFTKMEAAELKGLYLLTDSAAGFFKKLGFKPVSRDVAPDGLRKTAQFSSLCPASATVMVLL